MLKEQLIYRCIKCDTTAEYREGEEAPVCCDEKMVAEPLPQCTSASHPEMARNYYDDEPCNDGRGWEY